MQKPLRDGVTGPVSIKQLAARDDGVTIGAGYNLMGSGYDDTSSLGLQDSWMEKLMRSTKPPYPLESGARKSNWSGSSRK